MSVESSEDTDLPIFVKWMDFLEWLLRATAKFPKNSRFSFAQRIDCIALDIIEDLVHPKNPTEG